jgi:hypothetical protein
VSWDLLKGPCIQDFPYFLHTPFQSTDFELSSLDEGCDIEFSISGQRSIGWLDRDDPSNLEFLSFTRL